MRRLVWTPPFERAFKRTVRRVPGLRDRVARTLQLLSENPFNPALRTHKLTGILKGTWACSVDDDHRVLFEFVEHPETSESEILLLTIGTHDEVY